MEQGELQPLRMTWWRCRQSRHCRRHCRTPEGSTAAQCCRTGCKCCRHTRGRRYSRPRPPPRRLHSMFHPASHMAAGVHLNKNLCLHCSLSRPRCTTDPRSMAGRRSRSQRRRCCCPGCKWSRCMCLLKAPRNTGSLQVRMARRGVRLRSGCIRRAPGVSLRRTGSARRLALHSTACPADRTLELHGTRQLHLCCK